MPLVSDSLYFPLLFRVWNIIVSLGFYTVLFLSILCHNFLFIWNKLAFHTCGSSSIYAWNARNHWATICLAEENIDSWMKTQETKKVQIQALLTFTTRNHFRRLQTTDHPSFSSSKTVCYEDFVEVINGATGLWSTEGILLYKPWKLKIPVWIRRWNQFINFSNTFMDDTQRHIQLSIVLVLYWLYCKSIRDLICRKIWCFMKHTRNPIA